MKDLIELHRKTTTSRHYAKMLLAIRPLKDCLGINHFWYYRITEDGHYTYIGTHTKWSEYCFDNLLVKNFPIIRHPETQDFGISFMKNTDNEAYIDVQNEAWSKFGINFNINITERIEGGVEAFGFATETNHPVTEERLVNHLPLLCHFYRAFKKDHQRLIYLAWENQVNMSNILGANDSRCFPQKAPDFNKEAFLKKMGWLPKNDLTLRECDLLKLLVNGFPVSYIADQLGLSYRTVENYIATIKSKLYCRTKAELIVKAKELNSMMYLTIPQ